MIQSKKIGIITAVAVCLALVFTIALIAFSGGSTYTAFTEPEYLQKIFGTDVISIEILADESDWQEMIDHAMSEEFIMADVIVNGTKFQNVGIRPKGNSSLTHVAQSSESDRYSFRLQFDEYIKGQTCFGLESFVVNNMLGDNTYMKEYISYEMMEQIGVDAPCFGYANISVNGEAFGLYLAVELYNDSYESRAFGTTSGMLYNVKSMEMGANSVMRGESEMSSRSQQSNSDVGMQPNNNQHSDVQNTPSPVEEKSNFSNQTDSQKSISQTNIGTAELPGNNTGEPATPSSANDTTSDRQSESMGKRGSNGGSLEYMDDNSSHYSAIFNNVIGSGSENDDQKVIEALKALSEGRDLERYFDVDQILRYFAAHTIVVNLDSYSSSMAQNYYIYEKDGKLTILPWDYNLAWGGFQSSSASSVINFPIDTPVSGVELSARPLLEKLFANTEYLDKYHSYLQELMSTYFANGKWEAKIAELNTLISKYVKEDATAFCTYEEYQTAISAFVTLGTLRAESIQGQLDGTVPSTVAEQTATADQLISAGNLNLSYLGSMSGGKGDKNGEQQVSPPSNNNNNKQTVNMPNREVMNQAMKLVQSADGIITDEITAKLFEIGLTEEQIEAVCTMSTRGQNNINLDGSIAENTPNKNQNSFPDKNGNFPSTIATSKQIDAGYLITIGLLTAILSLAIIFVAKKKRSY